MSSNPIIQLVTLSLLLISLYCWRNGTTGRLSNQPEVTSPAGRGLEFKPRVYIQRSHFLPTCLLLPFLSSHHKTPHTQFTALPPCLHLYCYPYLDCQFLSSLWPKKNAIYTPSVIQMSMPPGSLVWFPCLQVISLLWKLRVFPNFSLLPYSLIL